MTTSTQSLRTFPETIWAGTEQSLEIAMAAHLAIQAAAVSGMFKTADAPKEDIPFLLSIDGNVGVITIKGPLVNSDSPYNRYYGVTSYSDIRRALIYAATSSDVKAILLDIASGGGAVSGVADTGNLIAQINKGLKPIWAYSDAVMASAAYWLGVSCGRVYNSNTATLGSVGVITTLMEYSKALKEAGVGVKVMRAGEFKALANPYEPLTKDGEAQVQRQLDAAYNVFIGHVADMRGVSVAVADAKIGQGREFFGQEAADAGVSDGITTFDALMGRIKSKLLDSEPNSLNNLTYPNKGNHMTRAALTEQQIAAAAAGAAVGTAAVVTPAAAVVTPAAADLVPATPAASTTPAATAASAAAPAADQVTVYLQGQLVTLNAALLEANVKLAAATERATALEATQGPLAKIAAQSVSNMRIGMGLSALDLSAMSATALLAEHASTEATFKKAFPVGGVAAVTNTDAAAQTNTKVTDAAYLARVKASTLN